MTAHALPTSAIDSSTESDKRRIAIRTRVMVAT